MTTWLQWALGCLLLGSSWVAMAADNMPTITSTHLQHVLARLKAGQTIKVAAIGGSITTGYATSPPELNGWAASVARWLTQQAQPHGGHVEFLNLGVSGTDSAAAVQRVRAQAVDTGVDLIFVEFGVNDQWLDSRVRTHSYEGLLRQLLKAPKHPAVVTLMLTQQGNQARDAVVEELRIARHYGVPAIDFGAWASERELRAELRWSDLYDEPIHPNQLGHDAIAAAVIEALSAAWQTARALPDGEPPVQTLPVPLYSDDYEFVREFGADDVQPRFNKGFERGGDVHAEWQRRPGGAREGWVSTQDDAQMSLLVFGRQIGVFFAESEDYRNLEAWVDELPPVILHGHNPQRQGYLGWAYVPVGIDLDEGAHVLHLRMHKDSFQGSGRQAGVVSIMTAGIAPVRVLTGQLNRSFNIETDLDNKLQFIGADQAGFNYVGRFDTEVPNAPAMAWSGSEVQARFSGSDLALRLSAFSGVSVFNVDIDGQIYRLALEQAGTQDYRLIAALPPGEHTLRLVKRTEGLFTQARFLGLLIGRDASLLPPPAPRALRLEFYGDSITAGACNGDPGDDQYEDLSSHDGTYAYGAITARRLDADYVGIAVSGIGMVRSWNELLMPAIYDRVAPSETAARAATTGRVPDVVLVNLGQNDFGFPQSRGESFPADYTVHYVAFIKKLQMRYPQARFVALLGGMSGWRQSPELLQGFQKTVQLLKQDKVRIWSYVFQADTDNHPRIDTHERLADELVAFLRQEVLQ